MGSVLMGLDWGGYGNVVGDAIQQNPIGCKPKGVCLGCLMGDYGGSNRDLKLI